MMSVGDFWPQAAIGKWYVGGFSATPIFTVRIAPNSASASA
jgi:hypothetical protein